MSKSSVWFPKASDIPTNPGVYRWFDGQGRILYVGKAKNLRARLTSYFVASEKLHERTAKMVASSVRIDWTIVGSEFEALQLEFTWIKEFNPPFNVQFRDDKSYPYLAISTGSKFPRVYSTRTKIKGKAKYFGPYTQAWAIRETIDSLRKVFPIRTCTNSQFESAKRENRPCLLADLGKCSAPCVDRVSADEHMQLINNFTRFLSGNDQTLISELSKDMLSASANLEFEKAGRLRDQVQALTSIRERSAVVLSDSASCDIFSLARDEYSAAIAMFKVRQGRIRGVMSWTVDLEIERTTSELVLYALENAYDEPDDIPKEILVPEQPENSEEIALHLARLTGLTRVDVRIPIKGEKQKLFETVTKNADHLLASYKLKRSSDFSARAEALGNLQNILQLQNLPLTIECYDISHLAGTNVVASKVVFVDGKPAKDRYRRYSIDSSSDDTESIRQILTRRFARALKEEDELPDLLLVDGGLPQVNAAQAIANEFGFSDLPIFGLAKRLEELWKSNESFPILLPRASDELFLLQHLRDEAHRFAIGYQKLKRANTLTSTLEEIPGLGQKRIRALLKHFGSSKRIAMATVEELSDLPGITENLAREILKILQN